MGRALRCGELNGAGKARARLTCFAAALLVCVGLSAWPALAQDTEEEDAGTEGPVTACARQAEEDGEEPSPRAPRFNLGESCLAFGADVMFSNQRILGAGVNGLPILLSPSGRNISVPTTNTAQTYLRMDWHGFTAYGRLGLSTELNWVKATGDDARYGVAQLTRLMGRFRDFRGGYGDSITSFFAAPIEANAFTPNRSVGLVSYDLKLSEISALTAAIESGPVLGSLGTRFIPIALDQRPYFVGRWLQTYDRGEIHLAAALTNRRLAPSRRDPTGRNVLGFAVTAGVRAQVDVLGQQDEASIQVTYADNAISYLGPALDLGGVRSRVAQVISARGVSATAAYTRNWSERWSSTVFGSTVDVISARGEADPRIASLRYGANLVWKPATSVSIGAEVSRQRIRLNVAPSILRNSREVEAEATIVTLTLQSSF